MRSWRRPEIPRLPGRGTVPRLLDTPSGVLVDASPLGTASLYVCGITPYDATHLGHAATYLAYDTLVRLWLDSGFEVEYVQNATDVDDPLLERAIATGIPWQDLAAQQLDLYRADMESLGIVPPDHFVAVTEMIEPTAKAIHRLAEMGIAYLVDDDYYFDIAAAATASPWTLGQESRLDRSTMLELAAERGGDPQRSGKRDPLDPLLWRAARDGEPNWPSVVGAGRPGWHIECSVIVTTFLKVPIAVNGGGSDLVFPHHEFTAAHTAALTGRDHAHIYSHAGMVSFEGAKMSKSLGNLVLVSTLAAKCDPRAIRLALLRQHYRSDWEYSDALLAAAESQLAAWIAWARLPGRRHGTLTEELRKALSRDLDAPAALSLIDARVAAHVPPGGGDLAAIDALLGIRL
jgi:L-cysteine:1D-myo-inositol 2-amino-2-deoxy-alpha-D-glucopyranoside ligase